MSSVKFSNRVVGDFILYEAIGEIGDTHALRFPVEILPGEEPYIPVILSGKWTFGPFPDDVTIEMLPGHTGHLNPKPAGSRVITCVEPGKYICCHPVARGNKFGHRRIVLAQNEETTIRQGATLVVATGDFNLNAGVTKNSPLIANVQSGDAVLKAISAQVIAVELWKL
jgi:hypothetical protein